VTIYAWLDYGYYDGLLTFSKLYCRIERPFIQSATVRWLGCEWSSESNQDDAPANRPLEA